MDYDYFAEQLRQLQRSESASTSEHTDVDPDMPPLEPISPLSTSQIGMDVDDNRDEHVVFSESSFGRGLEEVEMNVEDADSSEDPPLPEMEPVAAPTPRPNRRARVEDDDDDERDRRHPSQRITNPSSRQETRTSTPLPAPRPQLFAFDFLNSNPPSSSTAAASSPSAQPTQNASTSASRSFSDPQTTTPRSQEQPQPAPRQTPFPGFAISFDLDGVRLGPTFAAAPNANQQTPAPGAEPAPQAQGGPQTFADLFSNPGFLHDILGIEPDIDDPERADRLIKGLEEVPLGLVKRLERVGGIGATGTDLSGGDSGCAVCWEKLLPDEDADGDDGSKSKQKAASEGEEKPLPTIVALPCAHVFHADCLKPWFARPKQTTCPTCRFNIDPENLTFVPYRQRQPRPGPAAGTSASSSAPSAPPAPAPVPAAAPTPNRSEATSSTPGASASTLSAGGISRGRTSPTTTPPPRRAGSEPPLNRIPRPPTGAGTYPNVTGSFAIPGGHVMFVSQPIPINVQGQPILGERGQQVQQSSQSTPAAPQQGSGAPPPPAPAHPPSNPTSSTPNGPERPVFGPPPPPGMTSPTNLPDGVIAFDIAFPIPASLFGAFPPAGPGAPSNVPATPQADVPPAVPQAQNAQPRPTAPPFRFPTGAFAGLNFGRPAGVPEAASMTDLFRSLFQPLAGNTPAAGAAQATPAPSGPQPPVSGAPPTATSPPPSTNGQGPSPPEQPGTGNAGEGNRAPPPLNAHEALLRLMLSAAFSNPSLLLNLLFPNGQAGAAGPEFGATGFGSYFDGQRDGGPKKEWTLPPPPGNTLRQRIEKREHEAGLRCSDISCGIGPSDDEPYISEADAQIKQLNIHKIGKDANIVCNHSFHSSCLVSAERVALRGADASIVGNDVEVSCPVCRGAGSISKSDWDEGVHTLQ